MQNYGVVGAVICDGQDLLLVENRRRNGDTDWSPPGGVVDPGETPLGALEREVTEETALVVTHWSNCLYRVVVEFVHMEATLEVDVFGAQRWSGELRVDDPDNIVVDAAFFARSDVADRLDQSPRWVSEPLLDWLARDSRRPPLPLDAAAPLFRYRAERTTSGAFDVVALDR